MGSFYPLVAKIVKQSFVLRLFLCCGVHAVGSLHGVRRAGSQEDTHSKCNLFGIASPSFFVQGSPPSILAAFFLNGATLGKGGDTCNEVFKAF